MKRLVGVSVGVLLTLTPTGCGAADDQDMDDRYQECIDAGGDFSTDGRSEWECKNTERNGVSE